MNEPKVFGTEHILYFLITNIIMISLIILTTKKVKSEKHQNILFKTLGVLLLISIVFNRISVASLSSGYRYILPSSFCGASSLALAIITIFFKKDNKALHSVAYTGLLGGIMTISYPDFIGQSSSIFYPMTISGLLHHTITIYIVVLMLLTKYLKPQINKWHLLPIGLLFYMAYGLFLIHVLKYDDSMLIKKPLLDGTQLYWYTVGAIFLVVHFLFLLIHNKNNQKKFKEKPFK